jgi:hypothetical protein
VIYFAATIFYIGNQMENITIRSLFSKNLEREIRGTMNSVMFLVSSVGLLLFSKIGGYLYDNVGH